MSGQTNFTPGRENALNDAMQTFLSQFGVGGSWHDNSPAYRALAAANQHRNRPRRSVPAPGWFFIDTALASELERGRRTAKHISLDHLTRVLRDAYGKPVVVRGARQAWSATRSYAARSGFSRIYKPPVKPHLSSRARVRMVAKTFLCGLAWADCRISRLAVKRRTSVPKVTLRGGRRRRPPGSCFRSSRFFRSTVSTYP